MVVFDGHLANNGNESASRISRLAIVSITAMSKQPACRAASAGNPVEFRQDARCLALAGRPAVSCSCAEPTPLMGRRQVWQVLKPHRTGYRRRRRAQGARIQQSTCATARPPARSIHPSSRYPDSVAAAFRTESSRSRCFRRCRRVGMMPASLVHMRRGRSRAGQSA